MTLILAATNGREIVVGADTFVYEGAAGENAYRTYAMPKLRILNGGRWIVGFSNQGAGAMNLVDYLEANREAFNHDIRIGFMECTQRIGTLINQFRLGIDAKALLVGFADKEPRIYSWSVVRPDIQGGVFPQSNAIGCGTNLGLYILDTCKPFEDLGLEQLISAVYFAISEVVRTGEPRVRKPIDIGIVRPSGAEMLTRDSLSVYEQKSQRLERLIKENL